MASRNVIPAILIRLLAAVVGLAIVPLTLTFFVLCLALFALAMLVSILWWVITGEWLITDSNEVTNDN